MDSRRPFWPVILLLVSALLAEVFFFTRGYQSRDDLWQTFNEGAEHEQLEALFILANRDEPQGIDKDFVRMLLRSPSPRIREMGMLNVITRHTGHKVQMRYVKKEAAPEEAFLCRFWLVHQKVGRYVGRDELRHFFELMGED